MREDSRQPAGEDGRPEAGKAGYALERTACQSPGVGDGAVTAYRFVLNCTPTAQARVRHTVRCGHSVAYKSAGQKSAEAVLDDLLSARAPKKPLEGPLVLEFIAGMPIPASTPKKQREAMLRGEIAHTKKPDLDNMAKQLKDAMTRAGFWGDDKQVVALRCSKRYAAVPHWEVAVYAQEEA